MSPLACPPQRSPFRRFARAALAALVAALTLETGLAAGAADTAIAPDALAFFEVKIRPLLIERCYECHAGEKQKGGLRLDSREGWLRGGDSGPALVPGNPDASLLIRAVKRESEDLQMPPKAALSHAEIAALSEWVRLGAPDPRVAVAAVAASRPTLEEGRLHWAYRPLVSPPPPPVERADWPRGVIDAFVLAALETHGLEPVAEADPHTWLRRVSLDLVGLPPTPEEIADFVGDHLPGARERVVDRLLGSAAFGERWARHWLDLVGYADQLGTVNDVPAPHAWRYRDYVIRSFNIDKPFDRFIREQVAGDLLPAITAEERQDALVATGFLLLGEIHIVTADKTQLRADIVDHQISKVGTAFLGQTLGCVRCHDHKFDPINLEDYYGLAGIFASAESAYVTERGVWSSILTTELPETAAQRGCRERALREHESNTARVRTERADLTNQLAQVTEQLATDAASAAAAGSKSGAAGVAAAAGQGQEGGAADLKARKQDIEKRIAALDTRLLHLAYVAPTGAVAYSVRERADSADARIAVRGNVHALGAAVPRGFVRVVSQAIWPQIPPGASGRAQLADWLACADNPLVARVTVNRLWQKLFGEGLVRTVDYWGTRGDAPSHPELLDWLAAEFIRGGWSHKRLIRAIVLSRTYGLSSAHDAWGALRDPDNRLLWRAHRRRLDAESLRDAALAVAGELQSSAGGPALALQFLENVGGLDPKDVNPVSFRTSKIPDEQQRLRTIYLPVVRSRAQPGPAELRNLFDFVPPTEMTGLRPATSVPTQALFLMNSDFMKARAANLADRLLQRGGVTRRQRIEQLYLLALGRPITEIEAVEALRFLAADPNPAKERASWTAFCHALLSCNEFLFRL